MLNAVVERSSWWHLPREEGVGHGMAWARYKNTGAWCAVAADAAARGGAVPDIKFFNMDVITIAGRKVRALRHGMAGARQSDS